MPCSDGRDRDYKVVYEDRDNPETERKLRECEELCIKLEASLCALINEINRVGLDVESILISAGENGKVNIIEFWKDHQQHDRERLALELEKFSKDELDMIKELLS